MKSFEIEFPGSLCEIPEDTQALSQSRLNIDGKTRSNLFPWNGQFSPQLIFAFLETYARSNDVVLDPFMGSGTVLVEAARMGLSTIGSDINPAPFKIASLYRLCNVGSARRQEEILAVEELLHHLSPFSLVRRLSDGHSLEEKLKKSLIELTQSEQDARRIILEALVVLLDFYKEGLNEKRLFATWKKLRDRIQSLPFSRRRIKVLNADARTLPLSKKSVDLVVTSPPYINVFNYHQMYRASVEALGWNLLDVARSEIGSNRKHRGNRFLTVIQYCLDISRSLTELRRVAVFMCERRIKILPSLAECT